VEVVRTGLLLKRTNPADQVAMEKAREGGRKIMVGFVVPRVGAAPKKFRAIPRWRMLLS